MLNHINQSDTLKRYSQTPPPGSLTPRTRWEGEPPMTKKQYRYILYLAGLRGMMMKDLNRICIKAFNAYLSKLDRVAASRLIQSLWG